MNLEDQLHISHLNPNAIIRGAQLTLIGANRALQNPEIFTSNHYRQALWAVFLGIGIRLIIAIPTLVVRLLLRLTSVVYPLDTVTWDDSIIDGLDFIGEYVLQIPLFLMALMRYIMPTLDTLFMQSLHWVDKTYVEKHQHDNPSNLRDLYYPNLALYNISANGDSQFNSNALALSKLLRRFARKGCISLAVFALSYLPAIGGLVLPLASFYTFRKAVGLTVAAAIFGIGLILPHRFLFIFLQTYFASRSLTRELLEPYFARIRFTRKEKRNWFRSREGILFGFGFGFYILIKVPLVGVLIYGIAEASTAYLITKVTDPPPPPDGMRIFAASQQTWSNGHKFLSLSVTNLDDLHNKAT